MYVFSTDKQLVETSQESFIMHLKQKNYELLLPRCFLILFLPSQATTVYTRVFLVRDFIFFGVRTKYLAHTGAK